MRTLRLTQSSLGPDEYRVEVELLEDGQSRQTATAHFRFAFPPQEQEGLRWYLEDYLEHPLSPAPEIAAGIERRMAEMGTSLFRSLSQSSDDARDLWATLRTRLNDTRVEVVSEVEEATAIPWELLRDPTTNAPLALRARAFVRAHPQPAQRPQPPRTASGPIRILLVICRPRAGGDVPFRSVASRLIKGLGAAAREVFQLDVLRPPTFGQLGRVLREAKAEGRPYHVVHFDGHGVYAHGGRVVGGMGRLQFADHRPGRHGYLVFENPPLPDNTELVGGPKLGGLLAEADVPVLVLNACRSAHSEAPRAPVPVGGGALRAAEEADPHAKVRAYGSLAQEVMDAGVAGVVAMRYNVYVVTAAQFEEDLYATLAQGYELGEAATLGRKQLHDQRLREIAHEPLELQDWVVPVVYEAAPIALFPRSDRAGSISIELRARDATPARGTIDPTLPQAPDVGFFGRDETLLALDRAFDTHRIALLHAYAGSGKTSTAAEFARWYALTGGVEGPVLFTSLERYMPLPRLLDGIAQMFGGELEKHGIEWLTLDDSERRDVALQVLRQFPVLWIWDNVEPVAGFPEGASSVWSAEEQRELADFLRAARDTRAKFLLTSRRDERGWLGELPVRVSVPPMPMRERVQLTKALAERYGHRLGEVEDWRPLLRFTQGNPMTLTVLVGQALRDGLRTRVQIEAFVSRLRAGEAAFEDEESEGRSRSLAASLSYGFEQGFGEEERRQLALLHLFQGFINVDALRVMGEPEADWCVPAVRGLTREAGMALLDRAAEVGLLTAQGGGYYSIHPVLPWYFRWLFDLHYPASAAPGDASAEQATRAYTEAMGYWGSYYLNQYVKGHHGVIGVLGDEEANLLHARRLTRENGWWHRVIGTMQGLRALYGHTGRWAEWARLVEEIVPDFVDPATDGPLPGREERASWRLVTGYRARLASRLRRWVEAERLQRIILDWTRQHATAVLATPPHELNDSQRVVIRNLAVDVQALGNVLRDQSNPDCVGSYKESYNLFLRIGDESGASITALNLGHAYNDICGLRDLDRAEWWYRRSLELRVERDRLGRARSWSQLGAVALERFEEEGAAGGPEGEFVDHLNAALQHYQQSLELTPPDAVDQLAVIHNQLGIIYRHAGDVELAMSHYRESIRLEEGQGDLYGAALTRGNVARMHTGANNLPEAQLWAQAALRDFETYGDRATDEISRMKKLLADIKQAMEGE